MKYFIVKNDTVQSVVTWDGDTTKWSPPDGTTAILAIPGVGIRWTFDGQNWNPPVIEQKPVDVTKDRLFFELLSPVERVVLLNHIGFIEGVSDNGLGLPTFNPQTYAFSADPIQQSLAGLYELQFKLDMIGTIDLNHPDTARALDAFIALGVFGTDMSLAVLRKTAVLNNEDAP